MAKARAGEAVARAEAAVSGRLMGKMGTLCILHVSLRADVAHNSDPGQAYTTRNPYIHTSACRFISLS